VVIREAKSIERLLVNEEAFGTVPDDGYSAFASRIPRAGRVPTVP